MTKQFLLTMDSETVPDPVLLPSPVPENHFPKPIGHQVVAIGYLEACMVEEGGTTYVEPRCCRAAGEEGHDEPQLLDAFWSYMARRRPRLFTWNGRGFDLPVLNHRALVHGLSLPQWHQSRDRFANYRYRYATDWHCDLMDALGDHGAVRNLGLDETAAALGLPGKMVSHGSHVAALVAAGDLATVRAYCCVDVLNTFGIALRYMLLTGELEPRGYNRSVALLLDFLDERREANPHFGAFADAWRRSRRPTALKVFADERGAAPSGASALDRLADEVQAIGGARRVRSWA